MLVRRDECGVLVVGVLVAGSAIRAIALSGSIRGESTGRKGVCRRLRLSLIRIQQ
jgi:hypothetical protein